MDPIAVGSLFSAVRSLVRIEGHNLELHALILWPPRLHNHHDPLFLAQHFLNRERWTPTWLVSTVVLASSSCRWKESGR